MEKFLDALYKRLDAMEVTLAREKANGDKTNITENAIKDEKARLFPKILEKGKTIDNKIKTLKEEGERYKARALKMKAKGKLDEARALQMKVEGKLDEARALQKDADRLKNHATKLNSSRGGTRRAKRRDRGTRKNGF